MTYVPGMITLGFIILRFIIKFAAGDKNASAGPKEYTITSQLNVGESLIEKLQLRNTDTVSLNVVPGSNVVEVLVKRDEGFEKIGSIQDTELSIKAETGRVYPSIHFIYGDTVTLEFIYR